MILIVKQQPEDNYVQPTARQAKLLPAGTQLLYGNSPDNRARVVLLGSGRMTGGVRVQFVEDYHTRRTSTGNSFYRAGSRRTARLTNLWCHKDDLPV